MTYLIGDKKIKLNGDELTAEEEDIIRSHPKIFLYCLNSTTHKHLLSIRRIINQYTDIMKIYMTLLSKILDYDDLTTLTKKTKRNLSVIETQMVHILGPEVNGLNEGWEEMNYEKQVKPMAIMILRSCEEVLRSAERNLRCIEVFFSAFDNLKTLLIACLQVHARMICKLLTKALFLFELTTIANETAKIEQLSPSIFKQLMKIDAITSGIEYETKMIDIIYDDTEKLLTRYTRIILGKAILKRDVEENECGIIVRRAICEEAAEHVISIPLSGVKPPRFSLEPFTTSLFYLVSALLLIMCAILYRVYNVIFG